MTGVGMPDVRVPGVWGRDIADLLAPQGARRQPLDGFDSVYADIVDYIIRCTHRIWEQKDLGLIETHYADDCPIWTLAGPTSGVRGVIDGTTRTLAAFPDRTLMGDAVVWSGNEADGYLSSHRILSTATNHGAGEFGSATGRAVAFWTIADCLCRQNRIVEEWLVRDNSAIVLQLGLGPRAVAQAQAAGEAPGSPARLWWAAEIERVHAAPGTGFPAGAMPGPERAPEAFARWFVDTLLVHRRLGAMRDAYAPAARQHVPGGRHLFGHGEIIGWWAAFLGCFGGSRIAVDHVAHRPVSADPADGVDIALRWTLAGRHDGPVLYGPATGRDTVVLAVTHWRVARGRIQREWTLFDEIAVRRQLLVAA
jgi:predicted ester cyclase